MSPCYKGRIRREEKREEGEKEKQVKRARNKSLTLNYNEFCLSINQVLLCLPSD